MDKVFLCEWGDWDDLALHSYQPKKEEVVIDFFGEQNGYEDEHRDAIKALKVEDKYNEPCENHAVTRIS
jgi:hypothetical protein